MAVFGDLSVLLKLEQKNSSVPIGSYLYLSHTSLVIPKENLRTLIMKAAATLYRQVQKRPHPPSLLLHFLKSLKKIKGNKITLMYRTLCFVYLETYQIVLSILSPFFVFFPLKSSLVPLDTLEDSKGFVRIRNISKTKFWELKMNCNLTAVDTYYFKHVTTYSLLNKKITNV